MHCVYCREFTETGFLILHPSTTSAVLFMPTTYGDNNDLSKSFPQGSSSRKGMRRTNQFAVCKGQLTEGKEGSQGAYQCEPVYRDSGTRLEPIPLLR